MSDTAILAALCCRTIATRVISKFAPGCAACPAAAWVPQLVRKYLTAVQRDVQGNSLQTIEMTSAGQIPSSSCSFAQYELYVLTGILCYSRGKSRDLHSLLPHGEGSCSGLPCARHSLSLSTSFPNLIILHEAISHDDFFFFLITVSEAAKLSYHHHHLCQSHLGCNHFAFRELSHYVLM